MQRLLEGSIDFSDTTPSSTLSSRSSPYAEGHGATGEAEREDEEMDRRRHVRVVSYSETFLDAAKGNKAARLRLASAVAHEAWHIRTKP